MSGDINHWIGRPVGLVKIEGILAHLTIVSHQPLVIAAGGITFVAAIRGKIEPVPDEFAPEERAGRHHLPVGFVNDVLPFLGMETGVDAGVVHGIFTMLVDAGTRAIFTDADAAGWISRVDTIRNTC